MKGSKVQLLLQHNGDKGGKKVQHNGDKGGKKVQHNGDKFWKEVQHNGKKVWIVVQHNGDKGGKVVQHNGDKGGKKVQHNGDKGGSCPEPKIESSVISMEGKEVQHNGDKVDSCFEPEIGFYQPIKEETWEPYQALLSVMENHLGGFDQTILSLAADQVLDILKHPYLDFKMLEVDRINGVRQLISNDLYEQLLLVSDQIKDYTSYSTADTALAFDYIPQELVSPPSPSSSSSSVLLAL